jgi:hypothetical protein
LVAEVRETLAVVVMVQMDQIHHLAQLLPQQVAVVVEIGVTEAASAVQVDLAVQVVVLELRVVRVAEEQQLQAKEVMAEVEVVHKPAAVAELAELAVLDQAETEQQQQ